jgi:hypothetical protein
MKIATLVDKETGAEYGVSLEVHQGDRWVALTKEDGSKELLEDIVVTQESPVLEELLDYINMDEPEPRFILKI